MMDGVIILTCISLFLCGWVVLLQNRLRKVHSILSDATDLIIDIAEGNAEVHVNRTDRVITVKARRKVGGE
jgi:hypothetical protein